MICLEFWELGVAAILCVVFGWMINNNWRKE